MKSLFKYIQEKLVIKKGNYKAPRELPTSGVDTTEISQTINRQTHAKEKAHYDKMEAYKKKGSDPKRLARSIKDKTKLINRWCVAILIDWIDCAVVFRDEIINRGYATADELDVFILSKYDNHINNIAPKYVDARESIEEYLDEIGVKHE
jgi:hypothetical protein